MKPKSERISSGPGTGKIGIMADVQEHRRPVVVPNFGRQLRRQRDAIKRSRSAVCRALRESYGIELDRSTLLLYEKGTIGSPDPAIIWALARYYGLANCDELIAQLVIDRTHKSLRNVDIAVSPYSIEQRFVAESFGLLPKELQQSFMLVFHILRATPEIERTVHDFPKHKLGGRKHHEEKSEHPPV